MWPGTLFRNCTDRKGTTMYKQIELFPKEFNPIEEYAKLGTVTSGGKERIKDFFEHNKNLSERIGFLKKEYGTSGFGSPERKPNTIFRADANSKGHKFSYCNENMSEICMHITHKQVAMAISDLIERGEYI